MKTSSVKRKDWVAQMSIKIKPQLNLKCKLILCTFQVNLSVPRVGTLCRIFYHERYRGIKWRHKVTTRGKNNINIWLPVIISILIGQLRKIFKSKRPRSFRLSFQNSLEKTKCYWNISVGLINKRAKTLDDLGRFDLKKNP
jgi:hypothetical protein